MLEESAFKEKREIETRQNAEDLHRFLDFADIDWKNLKLNEFEVVQFNSLKTSAKTIGPDYQAAFPHTNADILSRRLRNFHNMRELSYQVQKH